MAFITSILQALNLTASLAQTTTNGMSCITFMVYHFFRFPCRANQAFLIEGLSILGTLSAPTLPDFLTDLNTVGQL